MTSAVPVRVLLALVLSFGAAFAAQAQAPRGEVEFASRTFEIARQLRCPVCVSESVGDSSSPIAIEMRTQIHEQLEAGRSQREILAFFQERYGDWILLEPPRRGVHLLVWLLPVIAGLAGAGGLALLFVRWTRSARQPIDASEADLARVRAAVGSGPPESGGAEREDARGGDA